MPIQSTSVCARFWSYVSKDGPTPERYPELGPCWPWTGGGINRRRGTNYGVFWSDGKAVRAHRVAWELACGPVPDGLYVLHRCDNPPCCNPAHLFLGTDLDNMRDKVAKGRATAGDQHYARTNPERLPHGEQHWAKRNPEKYHRGQAHPMAKLTAAQASEIHGATSVPVKVLASRYGVSMGTIYSIRTGHGWKSVTQPDTP